MNKNVEEQYFLGAQTPSVDWQKRLGRIIIALAIVGIGAAIAVAFVFTRSKPERKSPPKWVPLVQVQTFQPQTHDVMVPAMGTVVPAQTVNLKARVSGQVIAIHPEFVDGGFVEQGDLLVRLDDADYRLALAQRESDLVNARYALELEQGRQQVAKREWALLSDGNGEELDAGLALRKPHLDKARADLAAAEAAMRKAKLDLSRTRITAPFNAMVLSRSVDVGSQVSPQESLAQLVGTDTYWIRATLPVDRLDWIKIPQNADQEGSPVEVHYGADHMVQGEVVRLLGDLTEQGRMAKIIVAVQDPLARDLNGHARAPLLIDEYVNLKIQGRQLENVVAIPRSALRDDNTIWVLDQQNRLEIRTVTPVWRDAELILLDSRIEGDDRVVISDLPAPVEGMALKVEEPMEENEDAKAQE